MENKDFEPLSKAEEIVIYAYEKGYRVVGNSVIGMQGKPLRLNACGKTYNPRFSVRAPSPSRETYKVEASKLSAYQKFRNKIFNPDHIIRHMDSDPWNIRESNLELLTHHESQMVKSEETRLRCAKNAASKQILHDSEIIKDFYNKHKSYRLTQKQFGISSKGTLHYILNKR